MYGCLVCGCTENETTAFSYRGANFSLLLFTLACGFTSRFWVATHITKPTYEKQQKELMSLSYLKTLWPENNILQNNLCKWSASNLFNGSSPFIKWWNNQTHVHLQGNGKFSSGIWCTNCPTCTLSHDRPLGSIKNSHEPFSSSLPATIKQCYTAT